MDFLGGVGLAADRAWLVFFAADREAVGRLEADLDAGVFLDAPLAELLAAAFFAAVLLRVAADGADLLFLAASATTVGSSHSDRHVMRQHFTLYGRAPLPVHGGDTPTHSTHETLNLSGATVILPNLWRETPGAAR